MKKLIQIASLFFILALVFTSCAKEEPVNEELQQTDDSKETYKFSKSFSLKDDLGNSSEFTVYSDDEQWLDVQTADNYEFKVFTREELSTNPENGSAEEISNVEEKFERAAAYLFVNKHSLEEGYIGFSILPKVEEGAAEERWDFTSFAFGADGVVGATCTYVSESRPQERLVFDLDKRSSGNFWNNVMRVSIYNPGDDAEYCGTAEWPEWRARIKNRNGRNNAYSATFQWLTSC